MARLSFTIPSGGVSFGPDGDLIVAAAMQIVETTAGTFVRQTPTYLHRVVLTPVSGGDPRAEVRLSNASRLDATSPRYDFSDNFEQNGTITLSLGSYSLTLKIGNEDTSNPYNWTPDNPTEITTFLSNVRTLPAPRTITLEVADVVELDVDLRSAVGGTADLTRILNKVDLDTALSTDIGGTANLRRTRPARVRLDNDLSSAIGGTASLNLTEPDPVELSTVLSSAIGISADLTAIGPDAVNLDISLSSAIAGTAGLDVAEPVNLDISLSTGITGTATLTTTAADPVEIDISLTSVITGTAGLTLTEPVELDISLETPIEGTANITRQQPGVTTLVSTLSTEIAGAAEIGLTEPDAVEIDISLDAAIGGSADLRRTRPAPVRLDTALSTGIPGTANLSTTAADDVGLDISLSTGIAGTAALTEIDAVNLASSLSTAINGTADLSEIEPDEASLDIALSTGIVGTAALRQRTPRRIRLDSDLSTAIGGSAVLTSGAPVSSGAQAITIPATAVTTKPSAGTPNIEFRPANANRVEITNAALTRVAEEAWLAILRLYDTGELEICFVNSQTSAVSSRTERRLSDGFEDNGRISIAFQSDPADFIVIEMPSPTLPYFFTPTNSAEVAAFVGRHISKSNGFSAATVVLALNIDPVELDISENAAIAGSAGLNAITPETPLEISLSSAIAGTADLSNVLAIDIALSAAISGTAGLDLSAFAAAWPDDLPQDFLVRNYRHTPERNFVTFQPDQGPPMRRRLFTGTSDMIQGTMRMSPEQWDELHDFYFDTIDAGSRGFSFPKPPTFDGAISGLLDVKFTRPPTRTRAGADWIVTINLRTI